MNDVEIKHRVDRLESEFYTLIEEIFKDLPAYSSGPVFMQFATGFFLLRTIYVKLNKNQALPNGS